LASNIVKDCVINNSSKIAITLESETVFKMSAVRYQPWHTERRGQWRMAAAMMATLI